MARLTWAVLDGKAQDVLRPEASAVVDTSVEEGMRVGILDVQDFACFVTLNERDKTKRISMGYQVFVKIWNAYMSHFSSKVQGRRHVFCETHFVQKREAERSLGIWPKEVGTATDQPNLSTTVGKIRANKKKV